MPKTKMVYFNTEYMRNVLNDLGINQSQAAAKMGRGKSYISNIIAKESAPVHSAKFIATTFNCDYNKLTTEPAKKNKPVESEPLTAVLESDGTSEQFEKLAAEVSSLKFEIEILVALMNTPGKIVHVVSRTDDAITILKDMTAKVGGCEESDYFEKCKRFAIPDTSVNYAIKSLDCYIANRGYGKNCKRWIMRSK